MRQRPFWFPSAEQSERGKGAGVSPAIVLKGDAAMAITTTRGDTRRWIIYAVIAVLVLLVLAWLLGMFDGATDTATTPAPATTEEGTTAPAAPQ
jgi:hypothetical protein